MAVPASAGAYVFWNTNGGGSIGRADNDGSDADQNFITGAESAAPLAVDSTHLYYTTDHESQMGGILDVARTNLDGGEATLLPEGFLGQSGEGIGAVDADHVYWVDGTGIGRAKLDGSDREPEFLEVGGSAEFGGIAIYSGFVYWTDYEGGFGHEIGRANLSSKLIESQYVDFEVPEASGPRAIAVDAAGIFWTMEPAFDGTFAGDISHAGFGGTATLNEIPGVSAEPASGLAIEGSDLYWFDFEEGFGTSLAHAVVAGSGSSVNRHLVNHVGNGWLAVSSAGPSAVPGPPPPPAPRLGARADPVPDSCPRAAPDPAGAEAEAQRQSRDRDPDAGRAGPGPGRPLRNRDQAPPQDGEGRRPGRSPRPADEGDCQEAEAGRCREGRGEGDLHAAGGRPRQPCGQAGAETDPARLTRSRPSAGCRPRRPSSFGRGRRDDR